MSAESARGRFVWHDLMTPDPEAAQAFYTGVVGWGTEIWGEGSDTYTMWTAGETPVGGIRKLPDAAVAGGARPHWLAYVTVPDMDATLERAGERGAKVLVPVTSVPNVGRYAVIADPQGAVIAPYTPENLGDEPAVPPLGDFSWHELTTTDDLAAIDFYFDLFGWESTGEHDMGPMGVYRMYGRHGKMLGGIMKKPPEQPGPPAWLHYARVPDVNRAAATTRELGGQVIHGPMEVPGGDWICMGMDPQGGMFAVHEKKTA